MDFALDQELTLVRDMAREFAEKELFLREQIRKAQGGGSFEEAEALEKQLASEIRRLQEDSEEKKEKLRKSFAN